MATRKSMTLPIIITLIFIVIIIYLFTSIEQSKITCEKKTTFDSDIILEEKLVTSIEGKKINSMNLTKKIVLPDKFSKDNSNINSIKYSLDRTLSYLGKKVTYTESDNTLIVNISVYKNELLLLDNIGFIDNDGLEIEIDSNTKSSNVLTLKIGDNYTEGELMKRLKNNGYSCR